MRAHFLPDLEVFTSYAARTTGEFMTPHGTCDFKIEIEDRFGLICLKLNKKAAIFGALAWGEYRGYILWEKFMSIYQATHKTKRNIKLPKSPFLAMIFSPAYKASTSMEEQEATIRLVQAAGFGVLNHRAHLAAQN